MSSTLKFCKKCQTETERNTGGQCKLCRKARDAARYAANPEKAKAYAAARLAADPEKTKARAAAYRLANPDKIKASAAAFRAANPEKRRASAKAWRTANPDKMKAASAAWKSANTERVKARAKAWCAANSGKQKEATAAWAKANPDRLRATKAAWLKANPESNRIRKQNRRARERASGGVLSNGLSTKLFKLQKGKCACCQQPLGKNYHLDHIVPIALGGSNTDDNIQLLRAKCNREKSAKHPADFMRERGFLI